MSIHMSTHMSMRAHMPKHMCMHISVHKHVHMCIHMPVMHMSTHICTGYSPHIIVHVHAPHSKEGEGRVAWQPCVGCAGGWERQVCCELTTMRTHTSTTCARTDTRNHTCVIVRARTHVHTNERTRAHSYEKMHTHVNEHATLTGVHDGARALACLHTRSWILVWTHMCTTPFADICTFA